MKNTFIAKLCLMVLLTVTFISCATDELKVVKYEITDVIQQLPLDTLNYFHGPHSIRVLHDTLYIADQNNNRVVILSKDFQYAKTIGQHGKGPSEFSSPSAVLPYNDSVYVFDRGNSRIQIFDKKREYVGGFNIPIYPKSMPALTNRGNILMRAMGGVDDSALFQELDPKGEIVANIGIPSDQDNSIPFVSNLVSLETDIADNRYAAFYELPIVRKYDFKGELVWETNFNSIEPISNRAKEIEDIKKASPSMWSSLILDISLSEDRLYVLFSLGDKYRNIYGVDTRTGKIVERVDTDGSEHFKLSMDFVDDRLYFVDYGSDVLVKATRVKS